MRLFFDENLSPRLVSIAHARGLDATSARDRDLLGVPDRTILALCIDEDRVCVTNDATDFRGLVGAVDVHPGLIVLPNVAREEQLRLFELALDFIEEQAAAAHHEPRDLMVNRVVEVDVDVTQGPGLHELPIPE